MEGIEYCEQLRAALLESEEKETEKWKWRCLFVSLHMNPLRKEAVRERTVLEWDPTTSGGTACFFE